MGKYLWNIRNINEIGWSDVMSLTNMTRVEINGEIKNKHLEALTQHCNIWTQFMDQMKNSGPAVGSVQPNMCSVLQWPGTESVGNPVHRVRYVIQSRYETWEQTPHAGRLLSSSVVKLLGISVELVWFSLSSRHRRTFRKKPIIPIILHRYWNIRGSTCSVRNSSTNSFKRERTHQHVSSCCEVLLHSWKSTTKPLVSQRELCEDN